MSGDGKKMAPRKMNYRERQSINYQQRADPPFLAQMKKQLGYREYTIEDKVCTFIIIVLVKEIGLYI
jgi:hypothetical protein